MRVSTFSILTSLVVFIAITGCSRHQHAQAQTPALSAPPPVQTPIGPIPGPHQPTAEAKNPFENDPAALTDGRQFFIRYNCSGCHGGRAGGGMGPSLRDADWIYGSSPANVFDSIAAGRAHGMPAWGTRVPQDQIWKLTAYIKSLRTPNEPDAPSG